jgi:predicted transposase YdaD
MERLEDYRKKHKILIGKYVYQLRVLSNLRNLQPFIDKKLEIMPIEVDVSKDPFFKKLYKQALELGKNEGKKEGHLEGHQEGLKEGLKEGMQKGMQEGLRQKERALVIRLLKTGKYTDEQIADIINVSLPFVLKIKEEIQEK